MKTLDLSVGDKVHVRHLDRIVTVTAVHDGFIWTDVISPVFESEIDPIPLSGEILEKNRFRKCEYGYLWKERLYGYMGQSVSQTTPVEMRYDDGHCVVSNPHTGRVFQGSISYVNEFQQAMRIAGLRDIANSFAV